MYYDTRKSRNRARELFEKMRTRALYKLRRWRCRRIYDYDDYDYVYDIFDDIGGSNCSITVEDIEYCDHRSVRESMGAGIRLCTNFR